MSERRPRQASMARISPSAKSVDDVSYDRVRDSVVYGKTYGEHSYNNRPRAGGSLSEFGRSALRQSPRPSALETDALRRLNLWLTERGHSSEWASHCVENIRSFYLQELLRRFGDEIDFSMVLAAKGDPYGQDVFVFLLWPPSMNGTESGLDPRIGEIGRAFDLYGETIRPNPLLHLSMVMLGSRTPEEVFRRLCESDEFECLGMIDATTVVPAEV
jgi:hypothetical protein